MSSNAAPTPPYCARVTAGACSNGEGHGGLPDKRRGLADRRRTSSSCSWSSGGSFVPAGDASSTSALRRESAASGRRGRVVARGARRCVVGGEAPGASHPASVTRTRRGGAAAREPRRKRALGRRQTRGAARGVVVEAEVGAWRALLCAPPHRDVEVRPRGRWQNRPRRRRSYRPRAAVGVRGRSVARPRRHRRTPRTCLDGTTTASRSTRASAARPHRAQPGVARQSLARRSARASPELAAGKWSSPPRSEVATRAPRVAARATRGLPRRPSALAQEAALDPTRTSPAL